MFQNLCLLHWSHGTLSFSFSGFKIRTAETTVTPSTADRESGSRPTAVTPSMQSIYLQDPDALQVSAPRFSRSIRPSQAPHVSRTPSLASEREPEKRNRSRSRRRTRRGSDTSRRSSSNSPCTTHVSSVPNTYPENPLFPSVPVPCATARCEPQSSVPTVVPAAASPHSTTIFTI